MYIQSLPFIDERLLPRGFGYAAELGTPTGGSAREFLHRRVRRRDARPTRAYRVWPYRYSTRASTPSTFSKPMAERSPATATNRLTWSFREQPLISAPSSWASALAGSSDQPPRRGSHAAKMWKDKRHTIALRSALRIDPLPKGLKHKWP